MAPKRKRVNESGEASTTAIAERGTRSATRSATKATRSATSRGDAILNPAVDNPQPRRKSTTTSSAAAATVVVIMEHCKEVKKKANQVKKGLEKAVAGVNVLVNPENPREGCFEIREENGDVFVSLLDMEAPFDPLEELDMKKLVSDIVEKIK